MKKPIKAITLNKMSGFYSTRFVLFPLSKIDVIIYLWGASVGARAAYAQAWRGVLSYMLPRWTCWLSVSLHHNHNDIENYEVNGEMSFDYKLWISLTLKWIKFYLQCENTWSAMQWYLAFCREGNYHRTIMTFSTPSFHCYTCVHHFLREESIFMKYVVVP